MSTTLAKGAKLTPDTWADFVARLRHDCNGEGVREHCTADALFVVQARHIVCGISLDYTDQRLVYCDDASWYSPKEYWDGCSPNEYTRLDKLAQEAAETNFLALDEYAQWDILDNLPDHYVVGWQDRWEYVNAHFTKDAAEAFIKRKKHDYPDGIRVYVESQYYAWEFNAIKEAILSGQLTLTA